MAKVYYDRVNELRDVYLRHGINLTRYSTYQARVLLEILDASNKKIRGVISNAKAIETKEKYRRIASEIKHISNELNQQLNGQLHLDFTKLAEEETQFVENAVRSVGLRTDFDLPAPAKIWATASFGSYSGTGHETFETYLNGLSDNLYKTWDTNVRAGYLTGLTAQQINRSVLGSVKDMEPGQMQALRRSLETNTKTMVASLAETARDATYKANSRLFSGYRYVSTLDGRTCLVCGELDGKKFETLEEAPQLPAHHNCRCLYIPVIKGMEEFDADDERASVDGPVPANTTYEDWLKTQRDDVVRDILGPTRFEMYKNGVEISSFVSDGRTLTIEQLTQTITFSGFTTDEKWEDNLGNIRTIHIEQSEMANIENRENDPAIIETRFIEEQLKSFTYEVGTILDKNGDHVWQEHGEYAAIRTPLHLLKDNTFTHNHPMGGTFTPPDIQGFIKGGAIEIRASTPGVETYSLRATGGVDPKIYEDYDNLVRDNWQKINSEIDALSLKTKEEKNMVLGQKMTEICSPWLLENAHKYGCVYTIEIKE